MRDSLAIPSRLEAIDEARQWVAGHIATPGFDEYARHDVQLALTEALTNVVQHSYAGSQEGRIELELNLDSERLELTIVDTGKRFSADDYEPPELDEPSTGGYGVYLMGELMDEVRSEARAQGGTRLTMVKLRAADG